MTKRGPQLQIKRSVRCPACGTNYFEGEGGGCPKCSGRSSGVSRPLSGPMPDAPAPGGTSAPSGGQDPVCGWLLCLSGPQQGRYLRLFSGKNSIGGGSACMAPVDFAPGIHRGVSALILYDPASAQFFLLDAPGRDLVRLNGELLLAPARLHGGETVEIGGVPFRFVPLCGPKFRWD